MAMNVKRKIKYVLFVAWSILLVFLLNPTPVMALGSFDFESDSYGADINHLEYDGSTFYVAGDNDTVMAFDGTSGDEEWESSTYSGSIFGLAIDSTYAYIVGSPGTLRAIALSDGSTEYTSSASYGANNLDIVVDSTYAYIVGLNSDSIMRANLSDGSANYDVNYADQGIGIKVITLDSTEDALYTGDFNDTVWSVDASDGTKNWESGDFGETIVALAYDDTYVYVGGTDGKVSALNKTNGTTVWNRYAFGGYGTIVHVDDNYIYAGGSTNDTISALFTYDGSTQWTTASYGGTTRDIASDNELIYVVGDTTQTVRGYTTGATVTYDSNGGSSVPSEDVEYDSLATEPEDPTKTGYTFDGWHVDEELTIPFTFTVTTILDNITLYAKWTLDEYTVTYDSNGGSSVPSEDVEYDSLVTEPSDPTRTGYTFGGWFEDDDTFLNSWDFSTDTVTDDLTLYAKWTITEYTVTYDSNGGSSVSSEDVEHDTLVTEPSDPTRTGYTFDGWFEDDDTFLNSWVFSTDTVTDALTLYAKWTPNEYTVTYDSNGGSSVPSEDVEYASLVTEPDDPTQEGHAFGGWFEDDGTFLDDWDFSTDIVSGDTILYAKWLPDNLGTFAWESDSYGADINLIERDDTTFYVAGDRDTVMAFDGTSGVEEWESSVYDGSILGMTTDLTRAYIVGYPGTVRAIDLDDGSTVYTSDADYGINTQDIVVGSTYGYAVGTNSQRAMTVYLWDGSRRYTPFPYQGTGIGVIALESEEDTIYTGDFYRTVWSLDITDGSTNWVSVDLGEQIYDLAYDDNYVYVGGGNGNVWALDKTDGSIVWNYDAYGSYVYAIHVDDNYLYIGGSTPYTIKALDPSDGSEQWETPTYGGIIHDITSDNELVYAVGDTTQTIRGYHTIYSPLVTFDYKGGSYVAPETVDYGGLVPEPEDPTWDQHTFNGWFTDDGTYEDAWDFSTNTTSSDLTLYSSWTYIPLYTATFYPNNGDATFTQEIDYDEEVSQYVTEPEDPTLTGYTFDGWYEQTYEDIWTSEDFLTQEFNRDFAFEAQWSKNTYTVTFDSNGGSAVDSVEVEYHDAIGDLEFPTREGYSFDGWYEDDGTFLLEWDLEEDTVSDDMTLYADWNTETHTVVFNSRGGSHVVGYYGVEYGSTIEKPADPTLDYYFFIAWYSDAELTDEWNFNTDEVTEDMTLYAKWRAELVPNIENWLDGFNANTAATKVAVVVITIVLIVFIGAFVGMSGTAIFLVAIVLILTFISFGWVPSWVALALGIALFGFAILTFKGSKS